jgi:hypothetical protein
MSTTTLKQPQKPLMRYIKVTYVLDPSKYPNRTIEEFLFKNRIDGIYFDFINTTADLNNVEVSIDYGDWYTAGSMTGAEAYGEYFYSFRMKWLPTEDYKKIVVVYTGEKKLRVVSPFQSVIISKDLVGLDKLVNDYNLLSIDLSTARTDALIASYVVSMCIVDASAGATYSFKFFSTANDALDQNILGKGVCIEKLNRANVYLTNPAQSGYLKVLLWKVV